MITAAVVVGGGQNVLAELDSVDKLINSAEAKPVYFAINDMIPRFKHECIAVTLHPQKVPAWLAERRKAGLPDPSQVWAHHRYPGGAVTHATDDWRGSSGLFAVRIARQLGFSRIVLCGVPMQAEEKHFVRKVRWAAADSFRIAWQKRRAEISPFVRSMSGWTAEAFGKPDAAFLSRETLTA